MKRTVMVLLMLAIALPVVGTTNQADAYIRFNGGCTIPYKEKDGSGPVTLVQKCTFVHRYGSNLDARPPTAALLAGTAYANKDICVWKGVCGPWDPTAAGWIFVELKLGTKTLASCFRFITGYGTCFSAKGFGNAPYGPSDVLTCVITAASQGQRVASAGACAV